MQIRALLFCLLLPFQALAETAILEIEHLPLNEAQSLVQSQLSPSGSVTAMPSRNIIVVNDNSASIRNAKAILKKLDVPAKQYRATLELISLSEQQSRSLKTTAQLPNGWVQVSVDDSHHHQTSRRQYTLALTSGRAGNIESGTLQPYQQHIRQWLAGYGIIDSHSVNLVQVTSGFYATVRPAGEGKAHVRIVPWMKNLRGNPAIQGQTEVLIDLGNTNNPQQPPNNQAPVRLNANPALQQNRMIEIAGAATEVTIPIGETITIAANSSEAEMLGDALLSTGSTTGKESFAMRLRVNQR